MGTGIEEEQGWQVTRIESNSVVFVEEEKRRERERNNRETKKPNKKEKERKSFETFKRTVCKN
jgi:hypothetical protein